MLLLIDAYSLIYKYHHAGAPIAKVFSFVCQKLIKQMAATHLAVVFDSTDNFRYQVYPDYKSQRPKQPLEITEQIGILRSTFADIAVTILEHKRFEADDIIATLSRRYAKSLPIVIVSADKDLAQLIEERVGLYNHVSNRFVTHEDVLLKFMVDPHKIPEVLALAGDASDNIRGAKGIGIKTAAKLVNTFGCLDGIFANLDHIPQKRVRSILQEYEADVRLAYKLTTLAEVPIKISLEKMAISFL